MNKIMFRCTALGVVILGVVLPACGASDYREVTITLTVPFEYSVDVNGTGAFEKIEPIDYGGLNDATRDMANDATGVAVEIQSIDVEWEPNPGSTAENANFVLISSFGPLSSTQSLTGMRSPVRSNAITVDGGNGVEALRQHLVNYLKGVSTSTHTVGVRGTVNNGIAAGSINVTVNLTVSWKECSQNYTFYPVEADLPTCEPI